MMLNSTLRSQETCDLNVAARRSHLPKRIHWHDTATAEEFSRFKTMMKKTWRKRLACVLPTSQSRRLRPLAFLSLACLLLSSCVTKDTDHHIVISARDQKMALLEKG